MKIREPGTIPVWVRHEDHAKGSFYGAYPNTDEDLEREMHRLRSWGLSSSELSGEFSTSGSFVYPEEGDGSGIVFEIVLHDEEG